MLRAWLNDVLIHEMNPKKASVAVKQCEGDASVVPVSKRPRRGHIGFQGLSGKGEELGVRNAKFVSMD